MAPAIDAAATATAFAARGQQVQLTPLPPPPILHPTGQCDTLTAGLPGLNSGPIPTAVAPIGTSVHGRTIWAEYWGPKNATTRVVIVAQVHGNECAPTLLVEQVRQHPPTSYGIWLIPTLNPDGYATYNRRNAKGVDLNADGGTRSQPETRALYDFIAQVRPKLTVHVHSPNGFLGAYPNGAPTASLLCGKIALQTAMTCSGGGAGYRPDRHRWFLWQGLASLGGETLLVEFRAVAATEVTTARPRPPTSSVATVRAEAQRILAILDAVY